MSTEDMQIGITIDYEVWREISSVASLQQFARLRAIRIVVGLRSHPQFRWGTPLTRSDVVQVMEGIQKQFDTFRGKREVLAFEVDTTDKIPKVRNTYLGPMGLFVFVRNAYRVQFE